MYRILLLLSSVFASFYGHSQDTFYFQTSSSVEVNDTLAIDKACENGNCNAIEELIFITLDFAEKKAIFTCKENSNYNFEFALGPFVQVDERVNSCFILDDDNFEVFTIYFETNVVMLTKKNGHRIVFMDARAFDENSFWILVMRGVSLSLKSKKQMFVNEFDEKNLAENSKKVKEKTGNYLIDIDPLSKTIKVENMDSKEVVISVTYSFFAESSFENLSGFTFAEFNNKALFKITFIPDKMFLLNYLNGDRLILADLSIF